jgi:hypothetical protein
MSNKFNENTKYFSKKRKFTKVLVDNLYNTSNDAGEGVSMAKTGTTKQVERWDIYELSLEGPEDGNPFADVQLQVRFEHGSGVREVRGFYDGNGVYRIRFMPEQEGEWSYTTSSNVAELDGKTGAFNCSPAGPGNHGPVHVDRKHHFSYADGTPLFVMGTTAYAWTYRPEEVCHQTLESFSRYGFNKIRMLFFPKHYGDGKYIDVSYDPPVLPFQGEKNDFDFSYFDVEYFRNFENRVRELRDRNIQADVILFHFYDFKHWGIDVGMSGEDDLFFLDYLIARLSASRNVWWSLANEYDLLIPDEGGHRVVTDRKDWDRIGSFIEEKDPYDHPRSVHNVPFGFIYPDADWLTHVSYQHSNTYALAMDVKRRFAKPVINDEYQYEGNVPQNWGNASPELELIRHWQAAMAGIYATHGEAYRIDDNSKDIFWSYGGNLVGDSPKRLSFLKQIIESCPFQEMEPDLLKSEGRNSFCLKKGSELYLYFETPDYKDKGQLFLGLPEAQGEHFEVEVYDAWNCWLHSRLSAKAGVVSLEVPPWAVIKATRMHT